MEEASNQHTAFTVGNLGFFKCDHMLFGLCNVLATFQQLTQKLSGSVKPHLLPDLPRQLDRVLTNCKGAPPPIVCHV